MIHIAAPEGIDGLPVIANAKELSVFHQQPGQLFLDVVGVLVFIAENIIEEILVISPHGSMIPQQVSCQKKNVVEIHGILGFQFLLIAMINIDHPFSGNPRLMCKISFRRPRVFGIGNFRGDNGYKRLLDIHFADSDILDQFLLLIGGIDLQRLLVAHQRTVFLENFIAGGMKGADPRKSKQWNAGLLHQPGLHLFGGLVGEGNGQNAV